MIRRFALLQTFVAVARAGKMKQAAHELALTPGAVSQRIRQLEEAAGRRLFTRTSTGVELSAAGEAMFVALAEPFQAIEAVDRELGVTIIASRDGEYGAVIRGGLAGAAAGDVRAALSRY